MGMFRRFISDKIFNFNLLQEIEIEIALTPHSTYRSPNTPQVDT